MNNFMCKYLHSHVKTTNKICLFSELRAFYINLRRNLDNPQCSEVSVISNERNVLKYDPPLLIQNDYSQVLIEDKV